MVPQLGDIVIFTKPKHVAIVKQVNGTTVTLIEQNWVWKDNKGTYYFKVERTIQTTDAEVYFYSFDRPSAPKNLRIQ